MLIAHVVAVLAGVPGSFVAGAAVFGDGPTILSAERIVPVMAVYLATAAIFSFVARLISSASSWWRWGVSISLPAFFTVGLLGRDIGVGYQSLFIAIVVVSACTGGLAGALTAAVFRRRKR
jgi:hypothetical protein